MRQKMTRLVLAAAITVPLVAVLTFGAIYAYTLLRDGGADGAAGGPLPERGEAGAPAQAAQERQARALEQSPVPRFPEEAEAPLLEPRPKEELELPPPPPPAYAELLEDRALWPEEVRLTEAIPLPILTDNRQVGEVGLKAGEALEVIDLLPGGNLRVQAAGQRFLVRAEQTDLAYTLDSSAVGKIEQDPELIRLRKLAEAREALQQGIDAGFVRWARRNTDVTEIRVTGGNIITRLPRDAYGDAEEGRRIAELLAKAYIRQNQEAGGVNNYAYARILKPRSEEVWVAASYYGQ